MKNDSVYCFLVGHLITLQRREKDMHSKVERMEQEVVVAYFKVLSRHSSGENEENYENTSQDDWYLGWYSNKVSCEYK
jgi:hypothetical protein